MSKTLRVSLAMGGGVSLGSFSGSSLTEALKLLVLFGKDKEGQSYDKVVVDGMSGASAGAIALVIMLKTLIDYKKMMAIYNEYLDQSRTGQAGKKVVDHVSEESLLQDLANTYFDGKTELIPNQNGQKKELIALELAQKVQHQIWVERLNSFDLLGGEDGMSTKKKPHSSFGLLDRSLLNKLAKYYILSIDGMELDNIQLLDKKRVIFACSLTNMLPIEINLKQDYKNSVLEQNAIKSTGSRNHTELRVFDFVFDNSVQDEKKTDHTWFKLYQGPEAADPKKPENRNPKMDLDIKSEKAWSIVTASALACGAFPIAFDPVVLKRYKEEFNDFGEDIQGNGDWPNAFLELQKSIQEVDQLREKSFFNEKGDNYIDYNSFNFPYIDGGTFNNEPIREAFRIATYQDFGCPEEVDRLVLFVDPAVRQEKFSSFGATSFNAVKPKDKKTKYKTELDKLLSNVGSTVSLLANQGSIKEEHRIRDARENMRLRDQLFNFIDENNSLQDKITVDLVKATFNKIRANLAQGSIPIGTRSATDYFQEALRLRCKEDNNPTIILSDDVLNYIEKNINNLDVNTIYSHLNRGVEPDSHLYRKNVFAQTVFRMMIDFSLNTAGKNNQAEKMSILPIAMGNLNTIELPGHEIQAFSGFASHPSRDYTFEYGKLSTLISLAEHGIDVKNNIYKGYRDPVLAKTAIIDSEKLANLDNKLKTRLLQLKFYKPSYPFADDVFENLYGKSLDRLTNLVPFPSWIIWCLYSIPPAFSTFLAGLFGLLAGLFGWLFSPLFRQIQGKNILLKELRKESEKISYRKLIPITISILSRKKLSGKVKIKTPCSPGPVRIRMKKNKKSNGQYQYLFQLYYLEFFDWENLNEGYYPVPESVTKNKSAEISRIKRVGLTHKSKLKNPSIDSNLNFEEWRKAVEMESAEIEVTSLKFKKGMSNIIDDINNEKFSLFYSLRNLNYHVNPMIEYDMDYRGKGKNSWHFKENTKALYFDLMGE